MNRLVIEMDDETFAAFEAGENFALSVTFEHVELRQADGLLSTERRLRHLEVLGGNAAHTLGLPDGQVATWVYMAPKGDA